MDGRLIKTNFFSIFLLNLNTNLQGENHKFVIHVTLYFVLDQVSDKLDIPLVEWNEYMNMTPEKKVYFLAIINDHYCAKRYCFLHYFVLYLYKYCSLYQ